MSQIALIVAGLMPLLASGLICGIHIMSRKPGETPADGSEKQTLALMILPVLIGLGLLLLARLAPSVMTSPLPGYVGGEEGGWTGRQMMMAFVPQAKINWLHLTLDSITALYIGVVAMAALRLLAAQWRLWRIVRRARPLAGERDVRITGGIVPAFAFGAFIVLPERLMAHLSEVQLRMVIAHERAHLRRGDEVFFALLSWIDVVFWFNPFIRHQTTRCRLAAELACDTLVTEANPQMRQVYAASLLLALKHSAGNALQCVPAVISPSNSGEFKMRLGEIMRASGAGRKRGRWIAQVAAVALVLPLVGGQFLLSQNPAQASMTVATVGATVFSVMPVKGEIVSPYGPRTNPMDGKPQIHGGIDFRAPIGAPVYAVGDGRVVTVKTDKWNGLYVEIDQGSGYVTRYTHLNKLTVADNATVTAGQQIAEVGNSGQSTGSHLHFAVFKDGKPIDPATVLPQLHAEAGIPSIAMFADNINKEPDGVTTAWGNVEVRQGDRIIHADRVVLDPVKHTLVADGKMIDDAVEISATEF